ncbi:translation elongation factor Ts [Rhizomicrobium electricum]|jgi:elongation factor Ts|uniref:Elongation factor Ts n=1 Tax=Rhizomicrobium electricum TaxID=480070 RepID=A0ABN1ER45_9PROT|nr:translation elongation factor Ts [Rhizomicrobium electricum]NIJ48954.1 elongation factor Ts [Rhizomicrobium electricum]
MAEITASLVKSLRDQTGAGMMECKKALTATSGDLAAAEDWLRKNGALKAAKKATRTAAEGLIGLAVEGGKGVAVEVNAETDFVARNDEFKAFVTNVAKLALTNGQSLETLLDAKLGDASVKDTLTALIAKIGENMAVRRVASVEADVVASYVHNAVSPELGKIGVLVALKSTADKEKLAALGKQIAMHVAAASPIALDEASIPAEVVAHEKSVQAEIMAKKAVGKPANIVEKMLEGAMRKYYEEVCLLDQVFVVDQKSKISAVLEAAGKEFGAPVSIAAFLRFQVGEGIEKRSDDFADEVAKMAGN